MAKIWKLFAFTVLFAFFSFLLLALFSTNNSVKEKELLERYREEKLSNDFALKFTDLNEVKFDEILSVECDVHSISNTNGCLTKMEVYDLNKLNVEFSSKASRVMYHTFWQLSAQPKPYQIRVIKLNILSYLATQNFDRTKLIVWSLSDIAKKFQLQNDFRRYVTRGVLEFKIVDLSDLCTKGIFSRKYKICAKLMMNYVLFSDFLRFLVLYHYGGIYFDGDVILLRDMKPFWERNFVHRWSGIANYNTAVMGLRYNHGEFIERLYEETVTVNLNGGFYPDTFKDTVVKFAGNNSDLFNITDLEVISSVLFDPVWLCQDFQRYHTIEKRRPFCNFTGFYDTHITREEFSFNDFFPGAFTFHLHLNNCGSCKITEKSYFYHVEEHFKSKLTFKT